MKQLTIGILGAIVVLLFGNLSHKDNFTWFIIMYFAMIILSWLTLKKETRSNKIMTILGITIGSSMFALVTYYFHFI